MESRCDFVICGEAELALSVFLTNNLSGKRIKGVYALADLEDENSPFEKADSIQNLDDLPFPDWEQLNPGSYPIAPYGAVVKKFPVGIVMTTRGARTNAHFAPVLIITMVRCDSSLPKECCRKLYTWWNGMV